MKKTRIEIPIMHCFDNNYVIPAAVSFYSMLEHADKQYDYRLFVLHSDITVQNQKKLKALVEAFGNASLEFIDMNHQYDEIWKTVKNTDHLSKEIIYKLTVSDLFPDYDKMIITDVDVVFLGDISPSNFVFDDCPDAYYAGIRQINPDGTFLREYYNNYLRNFGEMGYQQLKICGGYLVANLKKQREDGIVTAFLDYLKKNSRRLFQPEQDVINFCCKEKQISYLPLSYVVCSYMYDICVSDAVCCSDPYYTYREIKEAMDQPIQLHYATKVKPWNTPDSTKAEIWFDYLKKTEFYEDYQNQEETKKNKVNVDIPVKGYFKVEKPGIKVSVLCASYNHERYIRQTLEGILNQKTSFDYEVIVADDASTDQTQRIICEYRDKYPEKMRKCILREKNVGIGENYYDALTKVEGEYLAICDGDDCWIDENKLQEQVDFLDANPDYMISCSDFMNVNIDDSKCTEERFSVKAYLEECQVKSEKLSIYDLIKCRFIASCTMMLRWQLKGNVPDFLKEYSVIDFPLNLIHSACGYIHVMDRITAEYHVHGNGISHKEPEQMVKQNEMLIKEVNQFLSFRINLKKKNAVLQQINIPQIEVELLKEYHGLKRVVRSMYHYLVPLRIRNRIYTWIHRV